MARFFQQAGEAIGSVVSETFPSHAHNWGNITPSADWGIDRPRWAEMLDEMRRRFKRLIDPCEVRPGETLSGARTEPLYRLQERMDASVTCPGDDDFEEG